MMNVLNLEECELLGDSKYRAYISQVEKALRAFEYTNEWADLISALTKLNKVSCLKVSALAPRMFTQHHCDFVLTGIDLIHLIINFEGCFYL